MTETLSALGYGDSRILRPEDLSDLRAAAEQNGYRFMPACYHRNSSEAPSHRETQRS